MKTISVIAGVAALALLGVSVAEAKGGGGHSSFGGSHAGTSHVNSSSHSVSGYVRKDGTVVQGYRATDPNSTRNDNYSTRGNTNPCTGQPGTKPRDGETPH
jgi:hypothetical protein